MDEFKQKLEETLNRLYKENKLSIDAYSELMEFADPNQNLQLQQTGVIGRSEQLRCFFCKSEDIVSVFEAACFCAKCIDKQETL